MGRVPWAFYEQVFSGQGQEFLELKKGTMTVMEYVARFTGLACFCDDYVATDMAKVRRFVNELKLSISRQDYGPPPTGYGLYGRDSSGYKERDGGRTGHWGCECRWGEEGGSAFFEFGKETEDFCSTSAPGTRLTRADEMLLLPSTWAHEKGLSTKVGILELWDSAVPVISGIVVDPVCSFSPSAGQRDQYQSHGAAQTSSATQIVQRG